MKYSNDIKIENTGLVTAVYCRFKFHFDFCKNPFWLTSVESIVVPTNTKHKTQVNTAYGTKHFSSHNRDRSIKVAFTIYQLICVLIDIRIPTFYIKDCDHLKLASIWRILLHCVDKCQPGRTAPSLWLFKCFSIQKAYIFSLQDIIYMIAIPARGHFEITCNINNIGWVSSWAEMALEPRESTWRLCKISNYITWSYEMMKLINILLLYKPVIDMLLVKQCDSLGLFSWLN